MKVSNKNFTKINYIILGTYILCFSIILFIFLKRRFFSNIEGLSRKMKKKKSNKTQGSKSIQKNCRYKIDQWFHYTLALSRGYGKPEYAFKLMYGKDYGRTPNRSAYPPSVLKLNQLRIEKKRPKIECYHQWLADLRYSRYAKELAEYKAKKK